VGDVCGGGVCAGTANTAACDDGDVCTDDSCDSAEGCVNTPNAAPCDDGNACTEDDVCGASCAGVPKSCDDGDGVNGTMTCGCTAECTSDAFCAGLGFDHCANPSGSGYYCVNTCDPSMTDCPAGQTCGDPDSDGRLECVG